MRRTELSMCAPAIEMSRSRLCNCRCVHPTWHSTNRLCHSAALFRTKHACLQPTQKHLGLLLLVLFGLSSETLFFFGDIVFNHRSEITRLIFTHEMEIGKTRLNIFFRVI
jgi:hypothetical protein